MVSHLVFLQTALLHHFVALLLEGNDDEGHKYVDEEEGEHHKINDIEDRHLHPVPLTGTPVLLGHIHRVLQNSAMPNKRGFKERLRLKACQPPPTSTNLRQCLIRSGGG